MYGCRNVTELYDYKDALNLIEGNNIFRFSVVLFFFTLLAVYSEKKIQIVNIFTYLNFLELRLPGLYPICFHVSFFLGIFTKSECKQSYSSNSSPQ